MNQLTTNPTAESLMALCMCNLDAYRQVARVTLDSTERLEKIGLSLARHVLDKSFSAAEHAGNGEAAAPDLSDWMRAQREIGDTLVNASQQLARTMSDYGTRLNQTFSLNQASTAMPLGFSTDALVNFWNQSYERYGALVKGMTEPERAAKAEATK
jgi:hypothetical protein